MGVLEVNASVGLIAAMYTVGKRMPAELRETALGGCAATPTCCGLCSGCGK